MSASIHRHRDLELASAPGGRLGVARAADRLAVDQELTGRWEALRETVRDCVAAVFGPGRATNARTSCADESLVSLGSGWRGYWVNQNTGNVSDQGMEIAKLQVGLDYRIDKAVAISPVVGADLSTFFTQQTPQSNGWTNISSPQVNTFFFAGLMGRFDIPTQSSSSQVASR